MPITGEKRNFFPAGVPNVGTKVEINSYGNNDYLIEGVVVGRIKSATGKVQIYLAPPINSIAHSIIFNPETCKWSGCLGEKAESTRIEVHFFD
jgi:hypothetical protein